MNNSNDGNSAGSVGPWVWAIPAAYAVHVLEEAFGGHGLMCWMAAGGGVDWSLAEFFGVNMAGLLTLCLAAWAARKWEAWRWPIVSGATIFIANGIWHAAICAMTGSYISGVLTGLLLYIPLGLFVMFRLRHLISPRSYVFAIVIGMVIHAATIWAVLKMPGLDMG